MRRIGRRAALRLGSYASIAAGALWWGAQRWAPRTRRPDDSPLVPRFHASGTAFWCALSDDGRRLVWYDDWRVQTAAVAEGRSRTLIEAGGLGIYPAYPHTAAVTPDGRFLVALTRERLVRLRCDTGERDREAPVPPGTRLLDVTADGARALVTLQPPLAGLVVVDLAASRVLRAITHRPPRLAWLVENGRQILLGDDGGGEPELWSVESGEALPSPWQGTAGVATAHVVGSRVALFCRDGWVRWLGGGRPLETPLRNADRIVGEDGSAALLLEGVVMALGSPGDRGTLAFGPDGRRRVALPGETILAVSARGDYVVVRGEAPREVLFGRLDTGRQWPIPQAGAGASGAAFSRDGSRLAVAGVAGPAVFDVSRPAPVRPAS